MLVPHEDFDQLTAYHAKCAACANIKLPQHSTVFRPDIEDDFDGFHDICQACVEQAAHDLGMVDLDIADTLRVAVIAAELARDEADLRHNETREAVLVLTRENVYLQAEVDSLRSDDQ